MRQHNSTIRVKKKNLDCGHFDFDFSHGRCRNCANIHKVLERDKKENQPEDDLSGLTDDADALVSRFVRLSAADENGFVKCYTCPAILPWTQMQAGHYVTRGCKFLRFDLRNIRPQCQICNEVKKGKPAQFSINLEKEWPGIVEELLHEQRIYHKVEREEIKAVIVDMTTKLSRIKMPAIQ